MEKHKRRYKYFHAFFLLLLTPLILVWAVFMVYLATSYVKRTYISPAWLSVQDIIITKDALEFRVAPIDSHKVSDQADMLLYGDSWTGGFGVPHGYSFSELIRNYFRGRYSVRIAGKNGSDLAQQYIGIKRNAHKPILSVIFFNLTNDYEGSMMQSPYGVPEDYVQFNAEETDVIIKPRDETLKGLIKYSPDFSYLDRYFTQPSFMADSFNNMLYRLGMKEDFWYNVHYFYEYFYSITGGWKYIKRHNDPQFERYAQKGYKLLDILFRDIDTYLEGRVLVVLLSPRECFAMDIYRRMYDVTAAEKGIQNNNLDYGQPRAKVIEILQKRGIRYIDVYPAMEKAILEGKDIFIPYNDHPNWLAHRVIFEAAINDIEASVARKVPANSSSTKAQ